jgi:hypothetical protein
MAVLATKAWAAVAGARAVLAVMQARVVAVMEALASSRPYQAPVLDMAAVVAAARIILVIQRREPRHQGAARAVAETLALMVKTGVEAAAAVAALIPHFLPDLTAVLVVLASRFFPIQRAQ